MSFLKHYIRPALKRKTPTQDTPAPRPTRSRSNELEDGELPNDSSSWSSSSKPAHLSSASVRRRKKPRLSKDDRPSSHHHRDFSPSPRLPSSRSPVLGLEPDDDEEEEESYGGLFQVASNDPLGLEQAFKQSSSFGKGKSIRNVHEHYEVRQQIEQGSYGVVVFGKSRATGELVALKRFKPAPKQRGRGSGNGEAELDLTSVREINVLRTLPSHRNIVPVMDIMGTKYSNDVYMVMRYIAHDFSRLLRKERLSRSMTPSVVKNLMSQLLRGVEHIHANDVVHRDMKPANLLYSDGSLYICDFGMSRKLLSRKSKSKSKGNDSTELHDTPMTPGNEVVTLYYRAPELLLGAPNYGFAVDMWSVGCIFAQFVLGRTLFKGDAEFDQLRRIFEVLGEPNERSMPGWDAFYSRRPRPKTPAAAKGTGLGRLFSTKPSRSNYLSDAAYDLLKRMLRYDPERRITAREALQHAWFREEPLACRSKEMPIFEDTLSPLGESPKSGFSLGHSSRKAR